MGKSLNNNKREYCDSFEYQFRPLSTPLYHAVMSLLYLLLCIFKYIVVLEIFDCLNFLVKKILWEETFSKKKNKMFFLTLKKLSINKFFLQSGNCTVYNKHRGRIQRKTWCMGPYAGVDYTSPYVDTRVDSNTFTMGQPYPRVDHNPMPEPTLSPSQGLRIWPQYCMNQNNQMQSKAWIKCRRYQYVEVISARGGN
jgi:hypothetical protein